MIEIYNFKMYIFTDFNPIPTLVLTIPIRLYRTRLRMSTIIFNFTNKVGNSRDSDDTYLICYSI